MNDGGMHDPPGVAGHRPPLTACDVARLANEHNGHSAERCRRCGGPNVQWSAPSPLWNEVMRGGSIDGMPLFDDCVCPICFVALAEDQGIASGWRLYASRVRVPHAPCSDSCKHHTRGGWCHGHPGNDVRWPCLEVLDDASPFAGQPNFPEELQRP